MAIVHTGAIDRMLGLSSDSKPTDVAPGSTFLETDTLDSYIFDGTSWTNESEAVSDITWTIGAENEGAETVNIGLQIIGAATRLLVRVFLSDDSGGNGITAGAPSGGWAVGATGNLIDALVAGKYALWQTDQNGHLDIVVTHNAATTWYAVAERGGGAINVSPGVVFAA